MTPSAIARKIESNDAFSHSMLVNVGSDEGVAHGQAVIDPSGLVGRIVDVGKAASRILLLTDVQSRVPVYIEGADVEGLLVGRTKARPAITFTQSSEPVIFEPGQRVLTSGAGGVLPRGVPVGVVSEDHKGEAIVDLYANYARTRLVRVLNYKFPTVDPDEVATPSDGSAQPEASSSSASASNEETRAVVQPTPQAVTPVTPASASAPRPVRTEEEALPEEVED